MMPVPELPPSRCYAEPFREINAWLFITPPETRIADPEQPVRSRNPSGAKAR
jgi:hypothetical protein